MGQASSTTLPSPSSSNAKALFSVFQDLNNIDSYKAKDVFLLYAKGFEQTLATKDALIFLHDLLVAIKKSTTLTSTLGKEITASMLLKKLDPHNRGYITFDDVCNYNTTSGTASIKEVIAAPLIHTNCSVSARQNHTAALVGNHLYIAGGYSYCNGKDVDYFPTSYFDIDNLSAGSKDVNMMFAGSQMTSSVVGSSIYFFGGGYVQHNCMDIDYHMNSSIVVLASKEHIFKTLQSSGSGDSEGAGDGDTKPPILKAHTASVVGTKIYMFGGLTQVPNSNDLRRTNIMHCYDTEHNTWELCNVVGDLPEPRSSHAACVVDKKIYIVGGIIDNIGEASSRNTDIVLIFDTELNKYSTCQVKNTDLFGHTIGVVENNNTNKQIFIYGGAYDRNDEIQPSSKFFLMDVAENHRLTEIQFYKNYKNNNNNNNNNNKKEIFDLPPLLGHSATTLPNGVVVVYGGAFKKNNYTCYNDEFLQLDIANRKAQIYVRYVDSHPLSLLD